MLLPYGLESLMQEAMRLTVVAVTKTFDAGAIELPRSLQDSPMSVRATLRKRWPNSPTSSARPHFTSSGQLQRNKVRRLAPYVDVWQSVDRPEVASEIANRAPGARIMVQVDISGEETKAGVEAKGLVDASRSFTAN